MSTSPSTNILADDEIEKATMPETQKSADETQEPTDEKPISSTINSQETEHSLPSPCRSPNKQTTKSVSSVHTLVSEPEELKKERISNLRSSLSKKRGWDAQELATDQFGKYMHEKQRKLREQFSSEQQAQSTSKQPFKGVTVWVDGRTSPSRLEIRKIVMRGGGHMETYLTSKVTHVIADFLAAATRKRMLAKKESRVKYVTSKWIVECEKDGIRKAERNFPIPGMTGEKGQKRLDSMFGVKNAGVKKKKK